MQSAQSTFASVQSDLVGVSEGLSVTSDSAGNASSANTATEAILQSLPGAVTGSSTPSALTAEEEVMQGLTGASSSADAAPSQFTAMAMVVQNL